MKLTHDTLAAIFRQQAHTNSAAVDELLTANEASDRRIALAEQLANDALACQSLRLANQLKPWATAVGDDLTAARAQSTPSRWQPARWLAAGLAFAVLAVVVAPQWHLTNPHKSVSQDTFFASRFEPATAGDDAIFRFTDKAERNGQDKPLFKARFEGKSNRQA